MMLLLFALSFAATPTTAPPLPELPALTASSTAGPTRSTVRPIRRALDRARLREVCRDELATETAAAPASSGLLLCAVLGAGLAAGTGTCGRVHDLSDDVRTGCDVATIVAAAIAGACGAVELATASPRPIPSSTRAPP